MKITYDDIKDSISSVTIIDTPKEIFVRYPDGTWKVLYDIMNVEDVVGLSAKNLEEIYEEWYKREDIQRRDN